MSRIGAIVRRLYDEEFKSSPDRESVTLPKRQRGRKSKLKAFKDALGSRRTAIWAVRIAVVLVILFIIAKSIFQFNRFASWETVVMSRRADVNRELQRRQNLIPNLVFAVSKYASYEQGVFKHVSDARETLNMIRTSPTSLDKTSGLLEKTLSKLVALAEEYPDLKATQSIQDLIKEAANTEDRIAEAKKEYNKSCETYNQYLSVFPGNIFAFIYRYSLHPYIGLKEEVEVPIIDLDMTGQQKKVKEDIKVNTSSHNIMKQKTEKDLQVAVKN